MIEFLLFIIAWKLWVPDRTLFYRKKLTEKEIDQVKIIVEKTLRSYPDALVGKDFPEIRYKVLCDLYREGEITKEYLHNQIDDIV